MGFLFNEEIYAIEERREFASGHKEARFLRENTGHEIFGWGYPNTIYMWMLLDGWMPLEDGSYRWAKRVKQKAGE